MEDGKEINSDINNELPKIKVSDMEESVSQGSSPLTNTDLESQDTEPTTSVFKRSHYRSLSDGCTLHKQALKAAYSDCNDSSSLQFGSPNSNSESSFLSNLNIEPSTRRRKSSVPLASDCSSSFDAIDALQRNENTSNALCGSRFPRPKPGESLVSFLSSADLYKNCGALDRENAHFYISEALMAAFEQMRFEMDCRAAGLITDSEDESDEEIKDLQEQIKLKKQLKLVRNVPLTSSTSSVLTQENENSNNMSTTDYSVYESPLSSTYTESSDQHSDVPDGIRHTNATGTDVVSRKHVFQRHRRRVLRKSSDRIRRDGNASLYPYDAQSDAPSVDGIDGVEDGGEVISVSSSSTLNNVDSEEQAIISAHDGERRASVDTLLVSPGCDEDKTASDNSIGHRRAASMDSCRSYKLSNGQDDRSAEGIGLKLLQEIAAPMDQLPKASELQWLVSERDAPQKLLPLPTDTGNLLLRGTSEWAPPREQLILTLQKDKKRSSVLNSQNYRCAGCGQQVTPHLSKHYRLCHYFMKYFCATCHMNQTQTIPAKVLHQWDIKQYPVSCFAHQFLSRLYTEPLYYPASINATLYHNSKALHQFRLYRLQLYYCLPYINSCSRAKSEQEIIKRDCYSHWYADKEVVSLQELVAIRAGTSTALAKHVLELLHTLTTLSIEHISQCQACQGRGFICEVCKNDAVIFPFELATVRVCESCGSCTHYRCVLSQCTRCVLRRKKKFSTS